MILNPRERPAWSMILTAAASTFVAGTALWVALSENEAARAHDRLSVRPKLDWRIEEDRNGSVTVNLVNVGLGPAAVRNVRLVYEGRDLGLVGERPCKELSALIGRDDAGAWEQICFTVGDTPDAEIYVKEDERLQLFHSVRTAEGPEEVGPVVGHISVSAEYCSFYGECFTLSDED